MQRPRASRTMVMPPQAHARYGPLDNYLYYPTQDRVSDDSLDREASQPMAIPNPYTWWWTFDKARIRPNHTPYDMWPVNMTDAAYALLLATGDTFKIATPSNYYCLCTSPAPIIPERVVPLDEEGNPLLPDGEYRYIVGTCHKIVISIAPYGYSGDRTFTATVTLSGTGGFTVVRDFQTKDDPTFDIGVPVPWDERRQLQVVLSGYSPDDVYLDVTVYVERYMRNRLLPKSVPAGWIPNPTCSQSRTVGSLNVRGPGMVPTSIRQAHSQCMSVYTTRTEETHGLRKESLPRRYLPLYRSGKGSSGEEIGVVSSDNLVDAGPVITASDQFAPWTGIGFLCGTEWRRCLSESNQAHTFTAGDYQYSIPAVNKVTNVILYHIRETPYLKYDPDTDENVPTAYGFTSEIYRYPNWDLNGEPHTRITLGSATISVPAGGTGFYHDSYSCSYPLGRSSDGALPGWLDLFYAACLVIEEPMPPPVSIPATDGGVAPGAYHESASVVAEMATIVRKAGTRFYQSEAPSTLYAVEFTGLPAGVYELKLYEKPQGQPGAYYPNTLIQAWDTSEISHRGAGAESGQTHAVVVPEGGSLFFAIPYMRGPFSNVGPGRSEPGSFIEAVAAPVESRALSLGDNTVGTNSANWGLSPSPAWLGGISVSIPYFQKFTAPTDGVYTFTLTAYNVYGFSADANTTRAVWESMTDPYAAHSRPDYMDPFRGVIDTSSWVELVNTPPVGGVWAGHREVLVGDEPTGAFIGHAGEYAVCYDPGFEGEELAGWRFKTPINGHVQPYHKSNYAEFGQLIRVDGNWVNRLPIILRWTKTMQSGEVVYYRIGTYSYYNGGAPVLRLQNGNGFIYNKAGSFGNGVLINIEKVDD